MNKIPVFGTVSRAYGFLLGEFGTIFRLAWAPLLIGAALNFYYGGAAVDAAINAKTDPAAVLAQGPANFLIGIAGFVLGVMVLVALLRIVIYGDRKPGLFVYLWFGVAEARLVAVYFLLLIALIALMFAGMLVFGVLAALATAIPVLGIVVGIGAFVAVLAFFWMILRLTLIPAVVVAEKSLGVERSWELMKGNALRLFAVILLVFLPFALLTSGVAFAILGNDFPPFPHIPGLGGDTAKPTPEEIRAVMEHWQAGFLKSIRAHWTEFSVMGFVSNLIQLALWAGVSGSAYTALAGEQHE